MNIALIGYGKMGKVIEGIAQQRGHTISARITVDNPEDLERISLENTDVAIEFTSPEVAYSNLHLLMSKAVPTVCGTTGWLEHRFEIEKLCLQKKSAFFYASNYSIGVNIFFALNKYLAKLMNSQVDYQISMEEIHHTEKKDAPSGTAITLAEGIFEENYNKTSWVLDTATHQAELPIIAKREPNVPGTHLIRYNCDVDSIEIVHTAHSRQGFALGAVLAAEFIYTKKGIFGMHDLLKM